MQVTSTSHQVQVQVSSTSHQVKVQVPSIRHQVKVQVPSKPMNTCTFTFYLKKYRKYKYKYLLPSSGMYSHELISDEYIHLEMLI